MVSTIPQEVRIKVSARITPVTVEALRRRFLPIPRSTILACAGSLLSGGSSLSSSAGPPLPLGMGPRMTPAEAMRGPMPSGRGGPALLERLLPPLRRLPAQAKMVLRGIGRNRRRSASTVTGVILALTLILTSWGDGGHHPVPARPAIPGDQPSGWAGILHRPGPGYSSGEFRGHLGRRSRGAGV